MAPDGGVAASPLPEAYDPTAALLQEECDLEAAIADSHSLHHSEELARDAHEDEATALAATLSHGFSEPVPAHIAAVQAHGLRHAAERSLPPLGSAPFFLLPAGEVLSLPAGLPQPATWAPSHSASVATDLALCSWYPSMLASYASAPVLCLSTSGVSALPSGAEEVSCSYPLPWLFLQQRIGASVALLHLGGGGVCADLCIAFQLRHLLSWSEEVCSDQCSRHGIRRTALSWLRNRDNRCRTFLQPTDAEPLEWIVSVWCRANGWDDSSSFGVYADACMAPTSDGGMPYFDACMLCGVANAFGVVIESWPWTKGHCGPFPLVIPPAAGIPVRGVVRLLNECPVHFYAVVPVVAPSTPGAGPSAPVPGGPGVAPSVPGAGPSAPVSAGPGVGPRIGGVRVTTTLIPQPSAPPIIKATTALCNVPDVEEPEEEPDSCLHPYILPDVEGPEEEPDSCFMDEFMIESLSELEQPSPEAAAEANAVVLSSSVFTDTQWATVVKSMVAHNPDPEAACFSTQTRSFFVNSVSAYLDPFYDDTTQKPSSDVLGLLFLHICARWQQELEELPFSWHCVIGAFLAHGIATFNALLIADVLKGIHPFPLPWDRSTPWLISHAEETVAFLSAFAGNLGDAGPFLISASQGSQLHEFIIQDFDARLQRLCAKLREEELALGKEGSSRF